MHQTRQSTIGEKLAVGLATGTIIRFVGSITNPLNSRSANETRLAIASVDSHLRMEGGNLLREIAACLLAQAVSPRDERGASRLEKTRYLFVTQPLRQLNWGKARGKENFV